jgi:PIN domain nuclease of toxin-antitoxin system
LGRHAVIVLDTHAFVWWAAGSNKLSAVAQRSIDASARRGLPAICLWESAMLTQRRRLVLDRDLMDWLSDALALDGVELLPLTTDIAVRSTRLGRGTISDPADRMIVATALVHGAPLVTRDERIRGFGGVTSIW